MTPLLEIARRDDGAVLPPLSRLIGLPLVASNIHKGMVHRVRAAPTEMRSYGTA